jgi:hypothetical protein
VRIAIKKYTLGLWLENRAANISMVGTPQGAHGSSELEIKIGLFSAPHQPSVSCMVATDGIINDLSEKKTKSLGSAQGTCTSSRGQVSF